MAALSLCCGGDSVERAAALHKAFAPDGSLDRAGLERLIAYLAETGQIAPKKQVAESDTKYPIQTYVRKGPGRMLDDALKQCDLGEDATLFDEDAVVAVLTAKAIELR